jgi:cytochrome P450
MALKTAAIPILLPLSLAAASQLYTTTSLSPAVRVPATAILFLVCLIALTHILTRLRYSYQLDRVSRPSTLPKTPPAIPYTLPFLGSALEFLNPHPGVFWRELFKRHPRETGACTLLLGGMTMHVLFDPTAVQALFRAKKPTRNRFNEQIARNTLRLTAEDTRRFYAAPELQEEMYHEFLLRTEAVNDLTREFTLSLARHFDADAPAAAAATGGEPLEMGIMEWLRPHMFRASCIALYGDRLLSIYPELVNDFWAFDKAFLSLFFGLPRIIAPKPFRALEACMAGMLRYQTQCQQESNGQAEDPRSDNAWEPIWGARANRARQRYYAHQGLSDYARAAMDLGMMFGLSSNAIPASGWFLMHLLDPRGDASVLPRVMAELETVRLPGGKVDVAKLVALPLMQSIFQEILRLYSDLLVSRETPEDLVLPVDSGRSSMLFRKGSNIIAPSLLGHYDANVWSDPPADVFCAERFLRTDPESGKTVFSMTGTTGKLFPFGGGRTMCPGRVFAKQEVLGAVAMTLLSFDFKPLGYVDLTGRSVDTFPGLGEQFGGSGIMAANGDIKVRITRSSK